MAGWSRAGAAGVGAEEATAAERSVAGPSALRSTDERRDDAAGEVAESSLRGTVDAPLSLPGVLVVPAEQRGARPSSGRDPDGSQWNAA
jgi:hypothetical protein